MSRPEELLVAALLEYVERYGPTEKSKEAFNYLGDMILNSNGPTNGA